MKKNKHYLLLVAATIALVWSCSPKTGQQTSTTTTSGGGKDIITPAGKKKFIDAANMNTAVRPQDDFFEYANGTWLKNTAIPATESRWGSFNELAEFNQNALKTISEELANKPGAKGELSQKVGDFYAAGMDSMAIEKSSLIALKPYYDRVNAIKSFDGLLEEIAAEYAEGSGVIFRLGVRQDSKNSTVYATSLSAGGINLPDRDLYLKDDERSQKIRKAYRQHIFNMFKLTGEGDLQINKYVDAIMKMETAFAKATMDRVERRDPNKTYNKMTVAEIEKFSPRMKWDDFFSKTKTKNAYYIVEEPNFLKELSDMLGRETLDDCGAT